MGMGGMAPPLCCDAVYPVVRRCALVEIELDDGERDTE